MRTEQLWRPNEGSGYGSGDAPIVNPMIRMLPKPKVKPPSSPFEEAQW